MGFLENLAQGIEDVSGVVETVGGAVEAVGGAVQSFQGGKAPVPTGGAYTNLSTAGVRDAIQVKINTRQPLTAQEQAWAEQNGMIGVTYGPDAAMSGGQTYPLTYYSGSASAQQAGMTQVGLLNDLGAALGLTSPAVQTPSTTQVPAAGGLPVPWWKGPGGKLQLPWNDPRIPQFLSQFALDDAYLRVYYRAPRGYVLLRDANGKPYAVLKQIARSFGLWKPSAKPPISATDYKHYKRNKAIEKKLVKIARPALRRYGSTSRKTTSKKR